MKVAVGDVERMLAAEPTGAATGMSGTSLRIAAEALMAAHAEQELLAGVDADAIAKVRKTVGADALIVPVPLAREDVHDVERLIALGLLITRAVR